ncbi:hypothetical protein AGMMS50222_11090 [Endomicrobiia bacterium]|nr:hypothetical protein AGMMS50222_11090 [Endomicrobiia bacterium]
MKIVISSTRRISAASIVILFKEQVDKNKVDLENIRSKENGLSVSLKLAIEKLNQAEKNEQNLRQMSEELDSGETQANDRLNTVMKTIDEADDITPP